MDILISFPYNGVNFVGKTIKGRRYKSMLFAPKEKGQGLVEYALILVLVAIVVIVILALLGPAIGNVFSEIMGSI
jgi:pilus assembly protein Flp/PilA